MANKVVAALVWATILSLAFWLNLSTPAWGDDWWRSESPGNLLHIFTRIRDEYFGWTGRSSTLFVTYLAMLHYPGSETVFDLANAIAWAFAIFTLFIAGVGRAPQSHNLKDSALISLSFLAFFLLPHSLGEAALWTTGSIAYLWPAVLACYLLRQPIQWISAEQDAPIDSQKRLGVAFVASAIVANSLENLGASLLVLTTFLAVIGRLQGRQVPAAMKARIAGFGVGFLSLAMAPGNFKRFAAQDDGRSMAERLPDLIAKIWQVEWDETHSLKIVAFLLLLTSLTRAPIRKELAIWAVFAAMLALSMLGSTGVNYYQRTAFVAEYAFLIVIVGLIASLSTNSQKSPFAFAWQLPLAGFILLAGIATVAPLIRQSHAINKQHQQRLETMRSYAQHELRRIYLPSIRVPGKKNVSDDIVDRGLFLRDIHGDTPGNEWRNSTYGTYHGFEFATRLPQTALLFLPDLEGNTPRFQKLAASGENALWLTSNGRPKIAVILSPGGWCANTRLEIVQDDKAREVSWSPQTQLAVIDSEGNNRTTDYCSFRVEIAESEAQLRLRNGQNTLLSATLPRNAP